MRCYVLSTILLSCGCYLECEAFSWLAPRVQRFIQPLGLSSTPSEWQTRNVYDDIEQLRQRIAQHQAEDNLREIERKELLDNFATNRRPLFRDAQRFILYPIVAAIATTSLCMQNQAFARIFPVVRNFFRMEFWLVVVASPLALLLRQTRASTFSAQHADSPVEQSETIKAAQALYSTLIHVEKKHETCSDETIACLVEQWASSVAGAALVCTWFGLTQTGQAYARLWPFLRLITRLGAFASVHQFPKLLYDLRRQQRPLNNTESRFQQAIDLMQRLAIVGMTIDLCDILLITLPRVVLAALALALLMICDLGLVISLPSTTSGQGALIGTATKFLGWTPYIVSGRMLLSMVVGRPRIFLIRGLLPLSVVSLGPILHLIAVLRLLRIQYTHDLSLANSSTRLIVNDTQELSKRMKWRYRLVWRQPVQRLSMALPTFVDELVFHVFFAGGVQDKILEASRQRIVLDTKQLEEKVQELDRMDSSVLESSKWVQSSIDNLTREHQRDYESGRFRDPLGVAVQQTFGVGLGFADGHMEPLAEGETPSARRLQSRAAKSAIRRLQDIYDETSNIDFEAIHNPVEREALKAKIRRREEAESTYLAKQLQTLVPWEDEGDDDDPEARVNLPKTSIRKLLRTMMGGVSEYDEPPFSGKL